MLLVSADWVTRLGLALSDPALECYFGETLQAQMPLQIFTLDESRLVNTSYQLSIDVYSTAKLNLLGYIISSGVLVWVLGVLLVGSLVYLERKKKFIQRLIKIRASKHYRTLN